MMTREEQLKKLQEMVNSLKTDLQPEVDRIEKMVATTQGHYGDYLALIGTLAKGNKRMGQVVALALLECGANRQGVLSALQLAV